MTHSTAHANEMLDHIFSGPPINQPQQWWVQLHTGDPGALGTDNAWEGVDRVRCTGWEVSSYGWLRNTVDLEWPAAPDTQSVGWATIWDASEDGTCLHVCILVRQDNGTPVVAEGDLFLIPAYYLLVDWLM